MSFSDIFSQVATCHLIGRPCIQATLAETIDSDQVVQLYVLASPADDLEDALITKTSSDGGVQVLTGDAAIYAALTAEDASELSPQALYQLVMRLVDEVDNTIVEAVYTFLLAPRVDAVTWSNPTTSGGIAASAGLSTNYLNTLPLLGEAGGAGYLDGVTTVGQAVNCVVTFTPAGEQPQTWRLKTSTDATDAGAKRRGLDYHGTTNTKVWFREV